MNHKLVTFLGTVIQQALFYRLWEFWKKFEIVTTILEHGVYWQGSRFELELKILEMSC